MGLLTAEERSLFENGIGECDCFDDCTQCRILRALIARDAADNTIAIDRDALGRLCEYGRLYWQNSAGIFDHNSYLDQCEATISAAEDLLTTPAAPSGDTPAAAG